MSLDLTGISLPFNAGDLLTSGVQLLTVVGPFVLLGLAFVFAPKIIHFIKHSAFSHGVRGTLERQDSEGNPIRSWRSRNAKYD